MNNNNNQHTPSTDHVPVPFHFLLTATLRGKTCYYLHLPMRKLRLREVKSPAQGHTANKWQNQDATPSIWFQSGQNNNNNNLR